MCKRREGGPKEEDNQRQLPPIQATKFVVFVAHIAWLLYTIYASTKKGKGTEKVRYFVLVLPN